MGSVVSKVGNVAKGALGGFVTGGPWGAVTGGLGGLFGGNNNGGGAQSPNIGLGGDLGAIFQGMGAAGGQGGGGIMDWLKGNAGTLGNLGLLGAGIAGHGNPLTGLQSLFGGLVNPRPMSDPRTAATGDFASLLSGAMANGGNIGEMLTKLGMGPAYAGRLNQGETAGQNMALGDANSALAQWFGGGAGAGAMDNINRIAGGGQQLNLPPEIAQLLGGGSQGTLMDQINSIIGGNQNSAIDALMGMGGATPEQSMLRGLIRGGPGQGQNALASLFQSPAASKLLGGGEGNDLGTIAQAIAAAQQPQLDRNVRDLREQFSFNGLRNSTDLNSGVAQLMSESQTGLNGILAQLAPQISATRNNTSLGALNALTGIGGQLGQLDQSSLASKIAALTGAGQLGLGGQSNQIQATGQSGSLQNQQLSTILQSLIGGAGASTGQADVLARLFGGQQSNATQAALAQPGAASTMAQLPQLLAQMNLGMNTSMQNQGQNDLTRQYQAWIQQQSLTPQLLQFLQSAQGQQYSPSILNTVANLGLTGAAVKQTK
jgi:hypothetical protein